MSFLHQLDLALFRLINEQLTHPLLDPFFWWITDPDNFTLLIVGVVLWVLWRGTPHQRVGVVMLFVGLALSDMISQDIKLFTERARPLAALDAVRRPEFMAHDKVPRSFSFPSAHAANISVIAGMIIWTARRRASTVIAIALAISVIWSRVYLGVHYPSDVLAGSLLGIACVFTVMGLRKHFPPLTRDEDGRWHPSPIGIAVSVGLLLTIYRLSIPLRDDFSLTGDEAQYWDWSRQLDWAYLSKPPMIAWLIRASTTVFGSIDFGVRAPAVVLGVIMSWAGWRLTRELFGSAGKAVIALALLNLTPMFVFGVFVMTTDVIVLACWGPALWLLWRAIHDGRRAAWIGAGLLVALGMLAKFAMLYLVAVVAIYLAVSPRHRHELRRAGFWAFATLGLAGLLPSIWWGAQHDWINFGHIAWQAKAGEGLTLDLGAPFEFLGSQLGVLTPPLFLAMLWGAWRLLRDRERLAANDAERFLLCTSLPILAALLLKSLQGAVQANWAVTAYFSWSILIAHQFVEWWQAAREDRVRRRRLQWLGGSTLALCLIVMLGLYGMIGMSDVPGGPQLMRASKHLLTGERLGEKVGRRHARMPDPARTFTFSNNYQVTSRLAFYMPDQPHTFYVSIGSRLAHYDVWGAPGADRQGWDAIYVIPRKYDDDIEIRGKIARRFERVEGPESIEIEMRDVMIEEYLLWRCYGYDGTYPQPFGNATGD